MLPGRPGKEPLGRHVRAFAQKKAYGAARFIKHPVEVNPLATHLEVALVRPARSPDRQRVPMQRFSKSGTSPTIN
jgi:hypothetical protein